MGTIRTPLSETAGTGTTLIGPAQALAPGVGAAANVNAQLQNEIEIGRAHV